MVLTLILNFNFLGMKNMQNRGFTLVELIVVITILAILGTIAFISLQGYSQEAKNSKVINDVRSLGTAIETSLTSGTINMSELTAGGLTANAVTGTFGWSGTDWATIDATNYKVGTINFVGLRQNGADFKDNEGNDYIAGTAISGSTNAFYQVAGQTLNADGTYAAVVKGNYIQIDTTNVTGLISNSGSSDWITSTDTSMPTLY